MAYRIEYSQSLGLPFYAEFLLTARDGTPLPVSGATHAFQVSGQACSLPDYGWTNPAWGSPVVEATEANGMLRTVDPGLIVVLVPAHRLSLGWRCREGFSLPFRLLSSPGPHFSSLIAEGTITFGDR